MHGALDAPDFKHVRRGWVPVDEVLALSVWIVALQEFYPTTGKLPDTRYRAFQAIDK